MAADGFGYKTAWFAVQDVTAERLARALALRDPRPCAWDEGVTASYDDRGPRTVFVTPPIDGWTLCTGTVLLSATEGAPPEFGDLLICLGTLLHAEVQFFASHRVPELHAWGRATAAGLARAYLYIGERGETVLNVGGQSAEESSLGFAFFDTTSPDSAAEGYWDRDDLALPDEDSVMQLAGRWSVNPSMLSDRPEDVGPGLLAKYGEPQTPELMAPQPKHPGRRRWKLW